MRLSTPLLAAILATACSGEPQDPAAPGPGPGPTQPIPFPDTYTLRITVLGDDPDSTYQVDTSYDVASGYLQVETGEQQLPLNRKLTVRLLGIRRNCTEEHGGSRPVSINGSSA